MEEMTIEKMMNLPRREFIEFNVQLMKEFNNGEFFETDPLDCPLHLWVMHNKANCVRDMVPLTMNCPLCGHPCCPECRNHEVDQLSRVTGYMAPVSGYNAAKKQEFKDRTRYKV